MWFGRPDEFYIDTSGLIFGPTVIVVLTLRSGEEVRQRIPAALAAALVLHDDVNNGESIASARILFGNLIDQWGGSC